VQGLASSRPMENQEPLSPSNRRISIIVMNREAEDRFFGKLPDEEQLPTSDPSGPADSTSTSAPALR